VHFVRCAIYLSSPSSTFPLLYDPPPSTTFLNTTSNFSVQWNLFFFAFPLVWGDLPLSFNPPSQRSCSPACPATVALFIILWPVFQALVCPPPLSSLFPALAACSVLMVSPDPFFEQKLTLSCFLTAVTTAVHAPVNRVFFFCPLT